MTMTTNRNLGSLFRSSLTYSRIISNKRAVGPSASSVLSTVRTAPTGAIFILPGGGGVVLTTRRTMPLTSHRIYMLPAHAVPRNVTTVLTFGPRASTSRGVIRVRQTTSGMSANSLAFTTHSDSFRNRGVGRNRVLTLGGKGLSFISADISRTTPGLTGTVAGSHCTTNRSIDFIAIVCNRRIARSRTRNIYRTVHRGLKSSMRISTVPNKRPICCCFLSVRWASSRQDNRPLHYFVKNFCVGMLYMNSIINGDNYHRLRAALPQLGQRLRISIYVIGNRGTTSNGNAAPIDTSRVLTTKTSIIANNGRAFHHRRCCSHLRRSRALLHPTGLPTNAPNHKCAIVSHKHCRITIVGLLNAICVRTRHYPFRALSTILGRLSGPAFYVISFRTRTATRGGTLTFCTSNHVSTLCNARARITATSRRVLPNNANFVGSINVAKPDLSYLNVGPRLSVRGVQSGLPIHFTVTRKIYTLSTILFALSSGANHAITIGEVQMWKSLRRTL